MKIAIYLFSILLVGCVSHDQIIRDPIFPDEKNYLICRHDGQEEYLMQDPLFEEEDNWLIYRED